jgi:hypothetical protein
MDIISGLDKIGSRVGFSVNGRNSFKTKFCGCLTLLYAIIILIYTSYQAFIMVQSLDTSFSKNTLLNYFD